MIRRTYKHFGFCCGIGSGAAGFNDSHPIVGNMQADWQCIGGIDIDPAALIDFERMTGAKGTLLDLFTREQYARFHDKEPPADWREATIDDIRRAAGYENPDAVFISSPCKGASGLLSEKLSQTPKYMALNELTLRCVWLMLEAWKDDPVALIVFENVPRLATRGRYLLDQISKLFGHYGYAVAETVHDCGEIGGLAQSRKRFLLVARHVAKVPAFLYQPQTHRLRSVGDILGRMPLAGETDLAGPMHRVPALQWKTWVRLAFVEAGSDWRSLNRLAVDDGYLRDYLIVPEYRPGFLGVRRWEEPTGTVAGKSYPTNGAFSVADPRPPEGAQQYQQYGVLRMDETAGAIIGVKSPGQGVFSVADPRHSGPAKFNNQYRIVPWAGPAGTVTSAHGKGQCVQDIRPAGEIFGKYACTPWDGKSGTVIARSDSGQGAYAVADPRVRNQRGRGDAYLTNGHYGVVSWEHSSGAVSAAACHDNGRWSVADPRLPGERENLVCMIRSLDDTWHRPFTTLELAALQSLFDPEDIWRRCEETGELRQHSPIFEMHGTSDQMKRERIGNAVPRAAGRAIADVMGTTLMLAEQGETFILNNMPVWVRDIAMALSVARAREPV